MSVSSIGRSSGVPFYSPQPDEDSPEPDEHPPEFICPITHELMTDPVVDREGHTFEKTAIAEWLEDKLTCPLDRKQLKIEDLAPNRSLKDAIVRYLAQKQAVVEEKNSAAHPIQEKKIPSGEAQAFFLRGKAFAEQGNYAAAVESLLKALELSPDHEKAQAYLEFLLERSISFSVPPPEPHDIQPSAPPISPSELQAWGVPPGEEQQLNFEEFRKTTDKLDQTAKILEALVKVGQTLGRTTYPTSGAGRAPPPSSSAPRRTMPSDAPDPFARGRSQLSADPKPATFGRERSVPSLAPPSIYSPNTIRTTSGRSTERKSPELPLFFSSSSDHSLSSSFSSSSPQKDLEQRVRPLSFTRSQSVSPPVPDRPLAQKPAPVEQKGLLSAKLSPQEIFNALEKENYNTFLLLVNEQPSLQREKDFLWSRFSEKKWGRFEFALILGRLDIAKTLFQENPKLKQARDDQMRTPLMIAACWGGHVAIAEWLVEKDSSELQKVVEVNFFQSLSRVFSEPSLMMIGATSLHYAVKGDNSAMAKWLIKQNRKLLNMAAENGVTPLHCAAINGDLELAQELITEDKSLVEKATVAGEIPVHSAAQEDHLPLVQWLAAFKPSLLHAFTFKEKAPLQVAKGKTFDWLLKQESLLHGITLDPADWHTNGFLKEWSLIVRSLNRNPSLRHEKIFKVYLAGAAKKQKQKEASSALAKLLYEEDPLLKQVNDAGQDNLEERFFLTDYSAWGLFELALILPCFDIVQDMYQADPGLVQQRDKSSSLYRKATKLTPLHIASGWGRDLSILSWLVEQNPSLFQETFYGLHANFQLHPLHCAATFGRLEAVQWFVKKDSSLLKKVNSYHSDTPLKMALYNSHWDVANFLIIQDSSQLKHLPVKEGTPSAIAKWIKNKQKTFHGDY